MANKICFIAGHGTSKTGGYDSGAVSKDGKFHEFKIVAKIAKYAQTYYNSTYVEQADCMNYDGDLYLADRIKKANAAKYELIAEIHLNSQSGGTDANGTECYYENGNKLGQQYADAICDSIAAELGVAQRKNWTDADGGDKVKLSGNVDYFGIIRQTDKCGVAVLVETVFISNLSDLSKVNTLEGQKKAGVAIAKAVATVRGAKLKGSSAAATKPATSTTTKPATSTKPTTKPVATTSNIKKGDLVKVDAAAVYYATRNAVPAWVRKLEWYVDSISGTRAVLGKSKDGSYNINSPIDVKYLTVSANKIKVGSSVKIKNKATDYNGKSLKSFVYKRKYKVKEIKGDRVVLTYLGITVAAMNITNIYLA